MDTVSLDVEQKTMVVADVNEYLHPSSPRWYSTRGIPWRRGYLFHGPPGTGKSSFSFAIAGLFGLDVFVISLLEPTLTESDLNRLFNNLPRRCVVLLEDIDTAGLLRDETSDKDSEDKEDKKQEDKDAKSTARDLAKAVKSVNRNDRANDEVRAGVSLSGLLNAIDGVASHEGRVLVMTTNHPEKLDAALIRPGRVDLQVAFTLATREQLRDIFVRMYADGYGDGSTLQYPNQKVKSERLAPHLSQATNHPDEAKKPNDMLNGKTNGAAKEKIDRIAPSHIAPFSLNGMNGQTSKEELKRLADQFANRLPEGKFSPAEVQGFLLIRKKEPYRAVAEVDAWRESMLEAKEKNSKVVAVQ